LLRIHLRLGWTIRSDDYKINRRFENHLIFCCLTYLAAFHLRAERLEDKRLMVGDETRVHG
jgi:hypothetical protein